MDAALLLVLGLLAQVRGERRGVPAPALPGWRLEWGAPEPRPPVGGRELRTQAGSQWAALSRMPCALEVPEASVATSTWTGRGGKLGRCQETPQQVGPSEARPSELPGQGEGGCRSTPAGGARRPDFHRDDAR